jgi:hypothetical protein
MGRSRAADRELSQRLSSVCGVAFTRDGAALVAATGGRILVFRNLPG